MDYNEKVQYLKSYRDKYDRITYIDNHMMGIKAINYGPSLGGHKSIDQYLAEKTGLMNEMEEIEDHINLIPDLKAKSVIGYKYLQFKTYQEIAVLMNFSVSQIRRFHKLGVEMLEIQKRWSLMNTNEHFKYVIMIVWSFG